MRNFGIAAGLALCACMGTARADDTKPVTDMNGAWNMEYPVVIRSPGGRPARGVPQCVLHQSGAQLTGLCKMADRGEGPVTGTVDGQHVELQWQFKFYPNLRARFTPAESDQYAVTTFKGDLDAQNALRGRYQSKEQMGWNRVFIAKKDAG